MSGWWVELLEWRGLPYCQLTVVVAMSRQVHGQGTTNRMDQNHDCWKQYMAKSIRAAGALGLAALRVTSLHATLLHSED